MLNFPNIIYFYNWIIKVIEFGLSNPNFISRIVFSTSCNPNTRAVQNVTISYHNIECYSNDIISLSSIRAGISNSPKINNRLVKLEPRRVRNTEQLKQIKIDD